MQPASRRRRRALPAGSDRVRAGLGRGRMDIEAFIARWTSREGGAERANYQMFLSEFCDAIGVPRPDPAGAERAHNDYVFERAVRRRASDEIASSRRIDLYKKGCFILEAKQSRLPGGKNALPGQMSLLAEDEALGRRSIVRGWDVMMQNARRQAEVSRSLEKDYDPEEAALFLMRCIFCMFAEDVDLLPRDGFTRLLEECLERPSALVPLLEELWRKMDSAERGDRFFSYLCVELRHFNGNLYRDA